MYEILMIIYLVVALALVGFILIQQGKGAGMGASFGSGASGTVFGAGGSGNFLTKATTVLAVMFFGVALGLGNLTTDKATSTEDNSLFSTEELEQAPATDIPDNNNTDLPLGNSADEIPVSELPVEETAEETEADPKKDDGNS